MRGGSPLSAARLSTSKDQRGTGQFRPMTPRCPVARSSTPEKAPDVGAAGGNLDRDKGRLDWDTRLLDRVLSSPPIQALTTADHDEHQRLPLSWRDHRLGVRSRHAERRRAASSSLRNDTTVAPFGQSFQYSDDVRHWQLRRRRPPRTSRTRSPRRVHDGRQGLGALDLGMTGFDLSFDAVKAMTTPPHGRDIHRPDLAACPAGRFRVRSRRGRVSGKAARSRPT